MSQFQPFHPALNVTHNLFCTIHPFYIISNPSISLVSIPTGQAVANSQTNVSWYFKAEYIFVRASLLVFLKLIPPQTVAETQLWDFKYVFFLYIRPFSCRCSF